jgi:O-antigen ligase
MFDPRQATMAAWRGQNFSPATALAAYWALPASPRYRQLVTFWFGVFCAGFCVLPGQLVQRGLFYAFVPLTLPAVVASFRRVWAAPLARVLAAFLLYSSVSALWSGQWLTVGDEARKALWLGYFLVLCCAIGEPGPATWRRIMRGVLVFAALFAVYSIAEFRWSCAECTRFVGFGARANANYTAMVAGAIGLLGLAAVLGEPGRLRVLTLAWQLPMLALLIATGGRAALLAYLSGAVLSVGLLALRGGVRRVARPLAAIATCLGVVGVCVVWWGGNWLHSELGRGDTFRLQIWSANFARVLERPWFGHGSTADDDFAVNGVVVAHHAHDMFLAQAFYGGLPGFALWLGVFVLATGVAANVWRVTGDIMPAVALFFLLAVGLVDIGYVVVDVQAIWLYVWVVLGIVLSYDVARRRAKASA